MKKAGLFLATIGFAGFLAGVSALAGRPVQYGDVITTACSAVTLITGYRIFSRKKETGIVSSIRIWKDEQKIKRNRNHTWQVWAAIGKIEGKERT
ncbi:MAG: hypothetical protein MSR29_10770 [Lachnospiraceae bacterium]|nr:hypothetical protein [Lachnospiraceae bacterium]